MNRKGQSSVEFIIVVGAALFFFSAIFIAFQWADAERTWSSQYSELLDMAYSVQEEIALAHSVNDGYVREFFLPKYVARVDYEIEIVDAFLYVRSIDGKHSFSVPVLNVTGNIQKGENIVKRMNGVVYLNQ